MCYSSADYILFSAEWKLWWTLIPCSNNNLSDDAQEALLIKALYSLGSFNEFLNWICNTEFFAAEEYFSTSQSWLTVCVTW